MSEASTQVPAGATRDAVPAEVAGTGQVRALLFLRDRGIIMLWLLLVAVFAVWAEPYFFTWTNARLVANAAALSALFAAAVAFGILSGALDLSIPGTAALAGVVAGKLIENGRRRAAGDRRRDRRRASASASSTACSIAARAQPARS